MTESSAFDVLKDDVAMGISTDAIVRQQVMEASEMRQYSGGIGFEGLVETENISIPEPAAVQPEETQKAD